MARLGDSPSQPSMAPGSILDAEAGTPVNKPLRKPGPSPLTAYRVLDLSTELGAYGSKLMADMGADVIKIEPPQGCQSRRLPPFLHGQRGPEHSLFHLYANTSKRSITLSLEHPEGRKLFRKLVEGADIVYESYPPGYLDGLGLGWKELHKLNPSLVLTSLTPFGQNGPYRDWKATDMVLWALSGAMYQCGELDGPPLVPGGAAGIVSYIYGATVAAIGTLVALLSRERSGRGQWVDISIHEVLVSITPEAGLTLYLDDDIPRMRAGPKRPPLAPFGHFPTMDGAVMINAVLAHHWDILAKWIHEKTGIAEVLDPMFKGSMAARAQYLELIDNWVQELTRKYTKQQFFQEAEERGLTAAPVNTMKDVVEDPHLATRAYWVEREHPMTGVLLYPGAPYKLHRSPWMATRAPLLGEHNQKVYQEELNIPAETMEALHRAGVI